MAQVTSIESLGYEPTFFHLQAAAASEALRYFTFDFGLDPKWSTYWDIIGVRSYGPPHRVDIRILHIEEDQLDDDERPGFRAESDAPGVLDVTPPMVHALIRFFTALVESMLPLAQDTPTHFYQMSAEDLLANNVDTWSIKYSPNGYYHYIPQRLLQPPSEMSIIGTPTWPAGVADNVSSALEFSTFDRRLVTDPSFHPLRKPGLGEMHFTRAALIELIALLNVQVPS